MSAAVPSRPARRLNWRLVAAGIAGAVLVLLVVANAHLVYVAVASQPDCVAHIKAPEQARTAEGVAYRAARSSC
ncbi:MAG: hypothetical protein M9895_18440 [Aquamicrobium sp.]|uniref:hypothetical protein n=1 Tax=Aquamicrobium sp. TaxID=1872579 RepID=UPI00349E90BD|nr:hypothetical protein [Aquamicrobium sp.]